MRSWLCCVKVKKWYVLLGIGLICNDVSYAQTIVGEASKWRNLVPARQLEQQAANQYFGILQQAKRQHALAENNHPTLMRLRRIADRLKPFVGAWNANAQSWQWEVNLIGSNQLNAFCMPGGKIVFYLGIIEQLQLTDDEIAIIMGHEVAHALREHARAQMGKRIATHMGAAAATEFVTRSLKLGQGGDTIARMLGNAGSQLLSLKFSRDDETDADLVGLELAAKAGFDPRAAIALWQKMTIQQKKAPPPWLSTHPTHDDRIETIRKNLKVVAGFFAKTQGVSVDQLGVYRTTWPEIRPIGF